jgi:hypothetical protein
MKRLLLTLGLLLLASTAHATIISWSFDLTGNLGNTITDLGSDGVSVLDLAGFVSSVPATIHGKQDAPIDHGYGVGATGDGEIAINDLLRLTFPNDVIGPVSVRLESVDGAVGSGERWDIVNSVGTILANGRGGGIVNTSVSLPSDHILGFTVIGSGPGSNDFLVKTVSAESHAVPNASTLLLFFVTGGAGVLMLRWTGRRPAR